MTKLRVAFIYDWADTNYGGAEKVLLTLKKIYPQAHLFTSFADFTQVSWLKQFTVVKTSFLQHAPTVLKKKKALLALFMPFAFERFDLQSYDLVISVCSFAAKGVLTTPAQKHFCYLLTPTRFLYSHPEKYRSPLLNWLTQPINRYLKNWEQTAIWRPDKLIVLSQLVASRSQRYYHRTPDAIIYPPLLDNHKKVSARFSTSKTCTPNPESDKDNFFLCVARLVNYKSLDLAIKACLKLKLPLKIVGTGPEAEKLHHLARSHRFAHLIEFLGNVDQKTLNSCYNKAIALIAPGEEDFGLNILEANQAQTWVIAHHKSGATELLQPQVNFWPIKDNTQKSLVQALNDFCTTWHRQKQPPQWLRPPLCQLDLTQEFISRMTNLIKEKE